MTDHGGLRAFHYIAFPADASRNLECVLEERGSKIRLVIFSDEREVIEGMITKIVEFLEKLNVFDSYFVELDFHITE